MTTMAYFPANDSRSAIYVCIFPRPLPFPDSTFFLEKGKYVHSAAFAEASR